MSYDIRTEKVQRIVQVGWRRRFFKRIPVVERLVVDYKYFVNGDGPFTIDMKPFKEPKEDSKELIKLLGEQ